MKFTIKEIHIPLGILVPVPPLEVCAMLDEEWGEWEFQDEKLGIDAHGKNEDEMKDFIQNEMDVLWRNYAMAGDAALDPGAIELKNALRQRFRFVGIM